MLESKQGVGERVVGRGEPAVGCWLSSGGGWGGGQGGGRWLRRNDGRGAVT